METKALQVEIKSESQGVVKARFATLGVKDKDGDLTEPGAFGQQEVRVSAYQHTSWAGALPVGKGVIQEDGTQAIADLQFFLDTQSGHDHFETIKNLGSLMEWSYGFDVLEEAAPSEEQAKVGVKRVLRKLRVHEVSPVLLGAGVDTATLAVKSETKTLTSARTPTFDGTEDTTWSKPTLADYLAGLNLEGQWVDLSAADRGRIVNHTLLGEASAETFDEANAFPVVNPRTGKLNGNAIRNAAARASQAGLPAATVDSVKSRCTALLDKYFKALDEEAELKEAFLREAARFEMAEIKARLS